jgi:hypothetical protein
MPREMTTYTVTLHEGGAITYGEPVDIEWTLAGEGEGECDKCANSYELSSRDNRCGDCGNCDTCCTHKGEGK